MKERKKKRKGQTHGFLPALLKAISAIANTRVLGLWVGWERGRREGRTKKKNEKSKKKKNEKSTLTNQNRAFFSFSSLGFISSSDSFLGLVAHVVRVLAFREMPKCCFGLTEPSPFPSESESESDVALPERNEFPMDTLLGPPKPRALGWDHSFWQQCFPPLLPHRLTSLLEVFYSQQH